MRKYEMMLCLSPIIDSNKADAFTELVLEKVVQEGGKIENIDVMGRRKLAYPIEKKTEAVYVVATYTATSETSLEIERRLKLNDEVLRFLTIRK
ncbi:MAG: 30S ribosomal protein S6 [Bifidobacteriaceae bacterium]|jgi:small subunit ribosomal protein S6|nr:30S ribosomal protein S6 [Bifidobacteriaceae bacterium]